MPILGLQSPGPSNPSHFSLESIVRPNILSLIPYRAARDDYSEGILLDANENALGPCLPTSATKEDASPDAADALALLTDQDVAGLNRYPSPTHDSLKQAIAKLRGVPNEQWVFLGVGSDEVIDMLYRVVCVPGKDVAITLPPTYGMYKVAAQTNDVGIVQVPLITEGGRFEVDEPALDKAFDAHPDAKLLFLCSPGNPTGTLIPLDVIRRILSNPKFKGVAVVDEAYIDFAPEGTSATTLVQEFANVAVSQTLSKGFGLAGIRLGFLIAPPPLVQILTNAKAPYNVSSPTASLALSAVSPAGLELMREKTSTLNASRDVLIKDLLSIPSVGEVLGGNHANFVMARILDGPGGKASNPRALDAYKRMAEELGVVVRFRGGEIGCEGCLRITVGTKDECEAVISRLKEILV